MSRTPGPSPRAGVTLGRVPEPTLLVWVVAVLATTVGETVQDLPGGSGATVALLAGWAVAGVVLAGRCARSRPVQAGCWPVLVLVGVLAAGGPDLLTAVLGLPLELGVAVLAAALAATMGARWRWDRALSVRCTTTAGREGRYWLAVLVTAALGAALADLADVRLGLGPWPTALLAALVLAAVAVSTRVFAAEAVLASGAACWTAGVLTRSLGAALGDGLAQPPGTGGLGSGAPAVGLALLAVSLGLAVQRPRSGRAAAPVTEVGAARR